MAFNFIGLIVLLSLLNLSTWVPSIYPSIFFFFIVERLQMSSIFSHLLLLNPQIYTSCPLPNLCSLIVFTKYYPPATLVYFSLTNKLILTSWPLCLLFLCLQHCYLHFLRPVLSCIFRFQLKHFRSHPWSLKVPSLCSWSVTNLLFMVFIGILWSLLLCIFLQQNKNLASLTVFLVPSTEKPPNNICYGMIVKTNRNIT